MNRQQIKPDEILMSLLNLIKDDDVSLPYSGSKENQVTGEAQQEVK